MTEQIVSFDPGEDTGWSILADPGGHEISHGIESYDLFVPFLAQLQGLFGRMSKAVVEDYALFKSKALAQSGSKLKTVRVIGMIEYWAFVNDIEVVYQSPQIKEIAQRWTGRKPPSDHSKSHDIDAFNHGIYYLYTQGRYELKV